MGVHGGFVSKIRKRLREWNDNTPIVAREKEEGREMSDD